MNKYEAMFIVKPDMPEEEKKSLFAHLGDIITKANGKINEAAVWAEKRKLWFRLKKYYEGVYYLISFNIEPQAIKEIDHAYRLNENILRVMITRQG